MRISRMASIGCVALLGLSSALRAQAPKENRKAEPTGDLTGVWYPSSTNTFNFIWTDSQGRRLDALPLTAWGDEKFKGNHPIGGAYTALTSNDPNFRCLPPGVPNVYTHAYPVEFLQVPGRTILFFEYGHFVRQIFTDGRAHPQDANPTWMGDSTGKWEGKTLVVDSTGFNDKTWLDVTGHPHSEAMHVIERMSRPDHDTLLIDITIDDPQTYTTQLKAQRKYILKPSWNIMEYICEDNQVDFIDFEKKVGTQGTKSADAAAESAWSESLAGDWKATIALADGRSFPGTANFSKSGGSIRVADPTVSINYQFQNVRVSADGAVTAITADGVNFLGKLSSDGKLLSGDIILPNGTGHKISMTRP